MSTNIQEARSAIRRPGTGWRHLAGAVYENANGMRVHLQGTMRLPDGHCFDPDRWPEMKRLWHYIRMNGGNRKRGLMAYAMDVHAGIIPTAKATP